MPQQASRLQKQPACFLWRLLHRQQLENMLCFYWTQLYYKLLHPFQISRVLSYLACRINYSKYEDFCAKGAMLVLRCNVVWADLNSFKVYESHFLWKLSLTPQKLRGFCCIIEDIRFHAFYITGTGANFNWFDIFNNSYSTHIPLWLFA